jgi:predicted TIM-barrel fold metal-dependent hydrolase
MKRRTWLTTACSAIATTTTAPALVRVLGAPRTASQPSPEPSTPTTPTNEVGWIDAHVHVWPKLSTTYPLASDYKPTDVVPNSFTPEELFQHCRLAFVQRVVLIQMSFFGFDNRYMLDSIARYPKFLSGVAIVDHQAKDLRDTMVRLRAEGVRGYRLYANAKNVSEWKNSNGVKDLFNICAETNQAACLLSDPEALPEIETFIAQYPDTTVVIDHFSRIGMRGKVEAKDLEALNRLARFKKTFVKTSAFYALGLKKAPYNDLLPLIKSLRDSFGADRLMWASDCPYQVQEPHKYEDSLAVIRDLADFLSDNEKKRILSGTAEQVFFQA